MQLKRYPKIPGQKLSLLALCLICASCSLKDLVSVDGSSSPVGTDVDHDVINTYAGAVSLYHAAIGQAAFTVSSYVQLTGLLTDELHARTTVGNDAAVDSRTNSLEGIETERLFLNLSRIRVSVQQARQALQRYPSLTPKAYLAELYALQGLAEVLLAESFCSGIPLGHVPFGGGFAYSAGLSTTEVLQHALAVFDTALTNSDSTPSIATLIRIGQGRAWLNLGHYQRAADAVSRGAVSTPYRLWYTPNDTLNFWEPDQYDRLHIVPLEGQNGLAWLAPTAGEQDPRIPVTTALDGEGNPVFSTPVRPTRYSPATTTFVVADSIEAHLIIAEAQLQPAANPAGPWLATLNALRASIHLADTTDPGSEQGRIDLLFRERAFWLYLSGHRQGDLRRLIRQYRRRVQTVYPVGPYQVEGPSSILRYENIVTMTPSAAEQERNKRYLGCVNREP